MKMAKKLLAVVLTGVMAMSVLTGCALGDAIAEKKLIEQLNNSVTTTDDFKGYEKNNKMDSAANQVVKDNKGNDSKNEKTTLGTWIGNSGTKTETDKTYTTGGKKYTYAYVVVEVPSNTASAGKWGQAANTVLSVDSFKPASVYKDSDSKKAQIGVSDSFKAKIGDKTNEYVVVTVLTKAAETVSE